MNSYLYYKEYAGSVDFSKADQCFYGKILNIDDLVSFESISVKNLKPAFRRAVKDYIKTCKQLNKIPLSNRKADSASFYKAKRATIRATNIAKKHQKATNFQNAKI